MSEPVTSIHPVPTAPTEDSAAKPAPKPVAEAKPAATGTPANDAAPKPGSEAELAAKPAPAKPAPVAEAKPAKAKPAPKPEPAAKPAEKPPVARPTPVPNPEPAPVPEANVAKPPTIRELKRRRARRLAIRMALAVGLPTILATVYYLGFATPQYESVTLFTIQSADTNAGMGMEFLFGGATGSPATRDVRIVQNYITSRDMMVHLGKKHGFFEHVTDPEVDWISRLRADAGLEDRFLYYKKHVQADYDMDSGALVVSVKAFSPEKAQELATAILDASNEMVNRMMVEARTDRIQIAQREVDLAERRLTAARQKLQGVQADRAELDPRASAEAAMGVKTALEGELAHARAELHALRATLQPGAPQLVAVEQRVAALSRQVAAQQRKLVGRGEDGLHIDIAAFEPMVIEKEFAEHAYASALKSLELARYEADRQHRYLVKIAEPSRPDDSTHPRVILAILTVFLLCFALFGIGSLIVASIREHANL